ncbi:hypothetical protein [Halovivax sp.]|uniref:hypothetical protein n=1 Tax=Halovivax sp. TaxID=1935978 RepID=UPI0025B99EE1|nr:hypothetical protein [Halovivax sp.]
MAFAIIEAMSDGFDRTLARNGLLLVGVFTVLAVLNALLTPAMDPVASGTPTLGPLAVLAGVLSIAVTVAWLGAVVVAVRTFVSEETERIPDEFVRHKMGFALLNVIVGGILFWTAVAIGSLFLLVPGLFLLVTLYYWFVFVAAEDQNAIAAMRSSWGLTKGSRFRLFGLGFAVVLVGVAVTGAFAIPAVLLGTTLGAVVSGFATAVVTVYALATTGRAYDQLRTMERIDRVDSRPGPAGTPA